MFVSTNKPSSNILSMILDQKHIVQLEHFNSFRLGEKYLIR